MVLSYSRIDNPPINSKPREGAIYRLIENTPEGDIARSHISRGCCLAC